MKIGTTVAIMPDQFNFSESALINMIGSAARFCHEQKDNEPTESDQKELLKKLISWGHLSPYEHANVRYDLLTDIATYKALTRHRHCAFTIESTHFIKYKDGLLLLEVPDMCPARQETMYKRIEEVYLDVLQHEGKLAARAFQPQGLTAKVAMTTNLRELFSIFKVRRGKENTPNMVVLIQRMVEAFAHKYPFLHECYLLVT